MTTSQDIEIKMCPICGTEVIMEDGVLKTHTFHTAKPCEGSDRIMRPALQKPDDSQKL